MYMVWVVRGILQLRLFDRAVGCQDFAGISPQAPRVLHVLYGVQVSHEITIRLVISMACQSLAVRSPSLAQATAPSRCYCKHCAAAYLDAYAVGA